MTSILSRAVRGRILPVLVSALALVGAGDLATYAATGHPALQLGTTNQAKGTTTLQDTAKGPALALKVKPGSPPLAVSSKTKVAKLNADLVDGLQGAALQNHTYTYTLPAPSNSSDDNAYVFPGLPAGTYLITANYQAKVPGAHPVICHVLDLAGTTINYGSDYGSEYAGTGDSSCNVTTVVVQGGGSRLTFEAYSADGPLTTTVGALNRVTFTRLDVVSAKSPKGTVILRPASH